MPLCFRFVVCLATDFFWLIDISRAAQSDENDNQAPGPCQSRMEVTATEDRAPDTGRDNCHVLHDVTVTSGIAPVSSSFMAPGSDHVIGSVALLPHSSHQPAATSNTFTSGASYTAPLQATIAQSNGEASRNRRCSLGDTPAPNHSNGMTIKSPRASIADIEIGSDDIPLPHFVRNTLILLGIPYETDPLKRKLLGNSDMLSAESQAERPISVALSPNESQDFTVVDVPVATPKELAPKWMPRVLNLFHLGLILIPLDASHTRAPGLVYKMQSHIKELNNLAMFMDPLIVFCVMNVAMGDEQVWKERIHKRLNTRRTQSDSKPNVSYFFASENTTGEELWQNIREASVAKWRQSRIENRLMLAHLDWRKWHVNILGRPQFENDNKLSDRNEEAPRDVAKLHADDINFEVDVQSSAFHSIFTGIPEGEQKLLLESRRAIEMVGVLQNFTNGVLSRYSSDNAGATVVVVKAFHRDFVGKYKENLHSRVSNLEQNTPENEKYSEVVYTYLKLLEPSYFSDVPPMTGLADEEKPVAILLKKDADAIKKLEQKIAESVRLLEKDGNEGPISRQLYFMQRVTSLLHVMFMLKHFVEQLCISVHRSPSVDRTESEQLLDHLEDVYRGQFLVYMAKLYDRISWLDKVDKEADALYQVYSTLHTVDRQRLSGLLSGRIAPPQSKDFVDRGSASITGGISIDGGNVAGVVRSPTTEPFTNPQGPSETRMPTEEPVTSSTSRRHTFWLRDLLLLPCQIFGCRLQK